MHIPKRKLASVIPCRLRPMVLACPISSFRSSLHLSEARVPPSAYQLGSPYPPVHPSLRLFHIWARLRSALVRHYLCFILCSAYSSWTPQLPSLHSTVLSPLSLSLCSLSLQSWDTRSLLNRQPKESPRPILTVPSTLLSTYSLMTSSNPFC